MLGENLKKNFEKAEEYYQLAEKYYQSNQLKEAEENYQNASALNHQKSRYKLANILIKKNDIESQKRGFLTLETSANGGCPEALEQYGKILLNGNQFIKKDKKKGEAFISRAKTLVEFEK